MSQLQRLIFTLTIGLILAHPLFIFAQQAGEKLNLTQTIEAAIKDLEEAMKGDDKEAIEAKTKALTDASGKLAERIYAQQAEAGPGASAEAGTESKGGRLQIVEGRTDHLGQHGLEKRAVAPDPFVLDPFKRKHPRERVGENRPRVRVR